MSYILQGDTAAKKTKQIKSQKLDLIKHTKKSPMCGSKKYPYPLEIPRRRGSRKSKLLKESMKLNCGIPGGWGG